MNKAKQNTHEAAPSQQPAARFYKGKEVLTQNTFDYSTAQVGDYVEQAVVDDAMNCLPPACMSAACFQMGEPYSHREDPDTGKWRATYATFKRCLDAPASGNTAATVSRGRLWSGA
mgnify:CR=1 FL=1